METRALPACCAILIGTFQLRLGAAAAEDAVFVDVAEKCTVERGKLCRDVTVGNARLALCLYAHEDKVSTQCGVAVYDAIVALQFSLDALNSYAKTCRSDLLKLCGATKWGEGRLYACLMENKRALAVECQAVLDLAKPELQRLGVVK